MLCLFAFSVACGEAPPATDCGIAEQVYVDSEVVLGRIEAALNYDDSDPNTDRVARDRAVAADYDRLAEIAEAGARDMGVGSVREATSGMVGPHRAAAEWSRRAVQSDADLPETMRRVQAVADSRQAFYDSCDNIPARK